MSQWFVIRDGKEHGPLSPQKLKELASAGRLRPTDLVRREDTPTARPAGQVKGLFPSPAVPSSPPPVPTTAPVVPPPVPAASAPTVAPPDRNAESDQKLKKIFSVVGPVCGVLVLVGGGIRGCLQASNRSQPATVAVSQTGIAPAGGGDVLPIAAPEPVAAGDQNAPAVPFDFPLVAGRPKVEAFLGYMKGRERFRLQTPEGGMDIEGTPFEDVFRPIGEPVRLHVGESDYLGEKVFVHLVETKGDGRLAALVLGTPLDLSAGRRRGNDVGSLSILMGSLVPDYDLRKLFREQPAKLGLGSGVSETFGKANVLSRLDRDTNEMRVIVTIDR